MASPIDTISGVRHLKRKIQFGADGTATDASNEFPLPVGDYHSLVAQGLVSNQSLVHKFGRNAALPNGSWAFVSGLGSTAWPLSAATTVRIKAGGNAADDAAGAGAITVVVQGIDDTFAEITETILTAGAAASVATTASFWRVHRAWVATAGTYGAANTAAIVIENGAGGTDIIQIATEEGQSQFAGWSVPTGVTAYLLSAEFSVDATKSANFRIMTRDNYDDASAPLSSVRIRKHFDGVAGGPIVSSTRSPQISLPAKSDIWIEGWGDGAGVEASASFELLLITA